MTETSYINPFSTKAEEIVKKLGNIENLDKKNKQLEEIVLNTHFQRVTKENIPNTIQQLALKKYEWFLFRKIREYNHQDYKYLFNPEIYQYDVVATYILIQAVAIEFGSDSHQAREIQQLQKELIEQRLENLHFQPEEKERFYRNLLIELIDTENLYWYDIKDLLKTQIIDINKLLLSNGRIIVEYDDFLAEFGDKIQGRKPRDIYNITSGYYIKQDLIKASVVVKTDEYMQKVEEMSKKMVEPNSIIKDTATKMQQIQEEYRKQQFESQLNSNTFNTFNDNKPVSYDIEAFAPCVKKCMEGIKSGGRNDAIVLFLTPFLSYARLYPGIFNAQKEVKISDVDPTFEITLNQVIPMIYQAADACRPPLFKDQPQEKININSKLGFGMHEELKIDYEGETQWYTPMSCDKVKLHMPQLCIPCKDCEKIGNPLTFYNRKRKINKKNNNNTKKEEQ